LNCFVWILFLAAFASAEAAGPNVLFIAIDDLRPELGCYGHFQIKSPAIDRIASEGMLFERAYCQQAVCGPSRLSMLLGVHPDRVKVYGMTLHDEWRRYRPGFASLPEQFRTAGWTTVGFGKIFDDRLGLDRSHSWDAFTPGWKNQFAGPEKAEQRRLATQSADVRIPAVEGIDVPDARYTEGHITRLAVDFLEQYDADKPFFLAVGFPKPHLPFVAPKKYWDLYERANIRLPAETAAPKGCTDYTLANYKEIFDYDVPNPVTQEAARELRHGYMACVSYVDAQIEKLVAALTEKGLLDNTVIVIWGDHGFKLGDYGEWAKLTNLELDARVPLIIRLPGQTCSGLKTKALVELVDLFPTLCEAAGLPVPDTVEGRSLLPILGNPEATVRDFALSQYPRDKCMGYSVRTAGWRYTEWRRIGDGQVQARELYNLENNPIEKENVLDAHPEIAAKHAVLLQDYLDSAEKWDGETIW
jgi:iduronate 2-sulfatase